MNLTFHLINNITNKLWPFKTVFHFTDTWKPNVYMVLKYYSQTLT